MNHEQSNGFGRFPRNVVSDGHLKGCTKAQALVYLALAAHAGADYRAWPSVATLAERTGLRRRAVQQALRDLEARGLVAVERGGGRGRANVYCLPVPKKGAPGGAVSGRQKALSSAGNSATPRPETAHAGARKGAPACAPTELNREEEQTGTEAAVAEEDSSAASKGNGNSQAAACAVLLGRLGIEPAATTERLAATEGLRCWHVVALAMSAPPDVARPAGWIRCGIEKGHWRNLDPPDGKTVCNAWQKGLMRRFDGYDLADPRDDVAVASGGLRLGYNQNGIHVRTGDETLRLVPQARLAEVEMS